MDLPDIQILCPLDFREPLYRKELVLPHAWAVQVRDVTYTAPQWLMSDGASIPRILWRLCPPLYDLHRPGAVLHDAAYKGVLWASGGACAYQYVSKEEADTLLFYLCVFNGMAPWRARIIYKAVDLMGGWAWKKEHAKYSQLALTRLNYQLPSAHLKTGNLKDMATGKTPGYRIGDT